MTMMNTAVRIPAQREPLQRTARKRKIVEINRFCNLGYSPGLNLTVIKGYINYDKAYRELSELLEGLKIHFSYSNKLNVYVQIESFDLKGVSYLLKLCQILGQATRERNDINVFWISENGNKEIRKLGSDLSRLCGFDFNTSF